MTVQELDAITERVKTHFLNETQNLSNNEISVVIKGLIQSLDEWLERIRSAREESDQ